MQAGPVWFSVGVVTVDFGLTAPAQKKGDEKNGEEEVLNFQKSRVGLGDVYAEQYEKEVFGNATAAEEQMSKEKLACKELFGKIMYRNS